MDVKFSNSYAIMNYCLNSTFRTFTGFSIMIQLQIFASINTDIKICTTQKIKRFLYWASDLS
jgi:hypothetical protein